jgi:hypothetical protein
MDRLRAPVAVVNQRTIVFRLAIVQGLFMGIQHKVRSHAIPPILNNTARWLFPHPLAL